MGGRGTGHLTGATLLLLSLDICVLTPPVPTLPAAAQYAEWVAEVLAMKEEHPLAYPHHEDVIMPQWAIEVGR